MLLLKESESDKIKRFDLEAIAPPRATKTYRPLSYFDAAETVIEAINNCGWSIVGEKYGLSKDKNRLFATYSLQLNDTDYRFAVGMRNSYDRKISYSICAGLKVFVCDNLVFIGERISCHKHNHKLEPVEVVSKALELMPGRFNLLQGSLDGLKEISIDDGQACNILVRLAQTGAINSSDIVPIFDEFKAPSYEEFQEPTKFNLVMAVTERYKRYKSCDRLDIGYKKLTDFLDFNERLKPVQTSLFDEA